MSELNNTLNEILNDKNTNLLPENLKQGVTCLGVDGNFNGTLSTVKSNLVVADYSKQSNNDEEYNREHYKEWWTLWNKNIIFRLPFDVGTRKYLCGITPNLNGTYDRWLIIASRTSGLSDIDFSRNDNTNKVYGSYWSERDTLACFKFNEVADISTIEDGYGSDELGVQCELSELPAYREYIAYPGTSSERTDHQIIFSIDTTAGYIGQNYTEQYHTPYGQVEVMSDMLHTDYTLTGNKIYNNLGEQYTGDLNIPFTLIKSSGVQLDIENTRDFQPLTRDSIYITNIPSTIQLGGKYYAIYEEYDNMMDSYAHSIYIVVADKPLSLKLHDYYERTNTSISSSQERWLFIYRTVGDDSCKIYRCAVTGWGEEKQAAYQRKFTKIFNSTDILWDFMNYGEITEETIPSYYDDGFIGLRPRCREEDYGNMRVITNCQIVELKNESNIILEKLATNQDIAENTKFIDIDGSIQHGDVPFASSLSNKNMDTLTTTGTPFVQVYTENNIVRFNINAQAYYMRGNMESVERGFLDLNEGGGHNLVIDIDDTAANIATAIGLTADKIKAGETILGITGTYTGEDVSL